MAGGDLVAEELFVLIADTGLENIEVIIAPVDLRRLPVPVELDAGWQSELYGLLQDRLSQLPENSFD